LPSSDINNLVSNLLTCFLISLGKGGNGSWYITDGILSTLKILFSGLQVKKNIKKNIKNMTEEFILPPN